MSLTHDEQALAASYVLDALDAQDREAFEAHLETCDVCRGEVQSLRPVVDALGQAVPQVTPRPELRARVLAGVTGVSPPVVRPVPARSAWTGWLPLAASLLVAAGLGLYARQLQGRLSTLETRLERAELRAAAAERDTLEARGVADDARRALSVVTSPDLARITLSGRPAAPGASANALWSRNRGMVFAVAGLPAAPSGRVYQVWVLTAKVPVSAGLLSLDSSGRATAIFQTPVDILPPTGVAVTLEPAGGVPQPTGEMYLLGAP